MQVLQKTYLIQNVQLVSSVHTLVSPSIHKALCFDLSANISITLQFYFHLFQSEQIALLTLLLINPNLLRPNYYEVTINAKQAFLKSLFFQKLFFLFM